MTASEQKRFELREGLIDLLGQDKAETLMEALPPVSWDQLATKNDLNTLAVVIGAEFTKVASEFTAVRGELTAVRGEFTAVRGEFTEQIGEVHKEIAGQTRTMVMWFVGIAATFVASAVAVCVTLVTQL